jgi:hypothetical protein
MKRIAAHEILALAGLRSLADCGCLTASPGTVGRLDMAVSYGWAEVRPIVSKGKILNRYRLKIDRKRALNILATNQMRLAA